MHPLQNHRILDLTQLLPGPYATLLLAEFGAEIIKVEPPTGDPLRLLPPMLENGQSARFEALNRGKKSVTLNLKDDKDRQRFLDLAQDTDAIIEGFRPGVLTRLGVDYETVKAINPSIVYASLTGYGQTGPMKDAVGHDLNYVSLAGVLSLTGQDRPVMPGFQIGDINGGLFAALTVMGALWHREQTGEGQYLDISMADSVAHGLSLHAAEWAASGQSPTSKTMPLCGGYPFYNIYETADGKWLSVGCLEPKFWAALCKALGLDHFIERQFAEGEMRDEIFKTLQESFKSKSLQTWLDELDASQIPIAPVNDIGEAMLHPQFQHRGLPQSPGVVSPIGHNQAKRGASPAPTLGQHNDELLK